MRPIIDKLDEVVEIIECDIKPFIENNNEDTDNLNKSLDVLSIDIAKVYDLVNECIVYIEGLKEEQEIE